jgi:CO/xanthine dehydrogenase FAD-binding subunit
VSNNFAHDRGYKPPLSTPDERLQLYFYKNKNKEGIATMPQLKAYHRPASVDEVLELLSRSGVNSVVMGGGTYLTARLPDIVEEIVDLQAVDGLDKVSYTGQRLILGAMVRLQTIVDDERAPALLRQAAQREGPNTLRNAATVGGAVVSPDRKSELLAALLVFEAEVQVQSTGDSKNIPLANFLRDVPTALGGGLVTSVSLASMGKTASARVARTPADKPIVAALARLGDDGQVRLALCGVDNVPVLIAPDNVKAGVSPSRDFCGSREYRRQMAATLARRVTRELSENG